MEFRLTDRLPILEWLREPNRTEFCTKMPLNWTIRTMVTLSHNQHIYFDTIIYALEYDMKVVNCPRSNATLTVASQN